jgi:hypothetical protein
MIHMLRALIEQVNNMPEQMYNVSWDTETQRKNKKEK